MSYVVTIHSCDPPRGISTNPEGTIWRCDCGQHLEVRRGFWDRHPTWHLISERRVAKILDKINKESS